jgi:hypothetical protein
MNLALFYGTEVGAASREPDLDEVATFEDSDIPAADLDYALVGHCRRWHLGRFHVYPGAAIAHDRPATAAGVAALVTMDEGIIRAERLEIASPGVSMSRRDIDLTGCVSKEEVLARVTSALARTSGFAEVRLVGRVPPSALVSAKELRQSVINVNAVFSWEASVGVDLKAMELDQTVRGEFVREVSRSPLSERERERILLIGLRALAAEDDLEVGR